ncbi:bh protein [Cytobacillus sp. NJ13]|nr:bh protein [Cytobacillus sp. NJ13]
MKISETDTYLFCSKCLDETLHHVRYLNGKINKIQCDNCKRTNEMNMDFKRELYKEVYKRITSKPFRLSQELKNNPNKLAEDLPKRVLSKPYRLMKYLSETKESYKKIKGE